jgi:hypothetical protein
VLLVAMTLDGPIQGLAVAGESICGRSDIYICDDFAAMSAGETTGGWYDWTGVSKQPQLDTSTGYTDSRSIRLDLAGAPVPIDPDGGSNAISTGTLRHALPDINAGQSLYCRWYIKWSNGFLFVPGGSGSKMFYLNAWQGNGGANHGNSNHRIRFSYYNPTGPAPYGPWTNPGVARLRWDTQDIEFGPNVGSPIDFTAGPWYAVEIYVRPNTVGVNNGEIKWWVNGLLQGSYPNIDVRGSDPDYSPNPGAPFNAISLDGYFGGGNTNAHPAQSTYYDNVVCSSNQIGVINNNQGIPSVATGITVQ